MTTVLDIELTAETLEKAARGLRRYRRLVEKILGNSPEEVKETLQAIEGLTPAQIRFALRAYKSMSSLDVAKFSSKIEEVL